MSSANFPGPAATEKQSSNSRRNHVESNIYQNQIQEANATAVRELGGHNPAWLTSPSSNTLDIDRHSRIRTGNLSAAPSPSSLGPSPTSTTFSAEQDLPRAAQPELQAVTTTMADWNNANLVPSHSRPQHRSRQISSNQSGLMPPPETHRTLKRGLLHEQAALGPNQGFQVGQIQAQQAVTPNDHQLLQARPSSIQIPHHTTQSTQFYGSQLQSPLVPSSSVSFAQQSALPSPTITSPRNSVLSVHEKNLRQLAEIRLQLTNAYPIGNPEHLAIVILIQNLEAAYRKRDGFFLFFHLIFCNWKTGAFETVPGEIRDHPQTATFFKLIQKALNMQEQTAMFVANRLVNFPDPLQSFIIENLTDASTGTALICNILNSFSDEKWNSYAMSVIKRRHPPMASEMRTLFHISQYSIMYLLSVHLIYYIQKRYSLHPSYGFHCERLIEENIRICNSPPSAQAQQSASRLLKRYADLFLMASNPSAAQTQMMPVELLPITSHTLPSNVPPVPAQINPFQTHNPAPTALDHDSSDLMGRLESFRQRLQHETENTENNPEGFEGCWATQMAQVQKKRKAVNQVDSQTRPARHPLSEKEPRIPQTSVGFSKVLPKTPMRIPISNQPQPFRKTLHLADLSDPLFLANPAIGDGLALCQFVLSIGDVTEISTNSFSTTNLSISKSHQEQIMKVNQVRDLKLAWVEPNTKRFRIRSIRSRGVKPTESEWICSSMVSPLWLALELNGSILQAQRASPNGHFGMDQPHDVTAMIKDGENILKTWDNTFGAAKEERGWVALEVVSYIQPGTVYQLAKENSRSYEQGLRAIKSKLDTSHDGIVTMSKELEVNLRDPISGALVGDFPVRGVNCLHINCFSLDAFLESRLIQAKPPDWFNMYNLPRGKVTEVDVWKCPICLKDARPTKLYLDEWMVQVRKKIIDQGLKDAKVLIVDKDGNWKVKQTSDDAAQNDVTRADQPTSEAERVVISLLDD